MPQALVDATVGDQLPERRVGPFTRMDFARFSISTDDPNRVHIEEQVAADAGLPDVIGSGGIVAGLLTDLVTSWGGLEALRSATLRVMAPLVSGTVLLSRGHVVRRDEDGEGVVEVEAFAIDDAGTRIGEGTFLLRLRSEESA